MGGGTQRPCRRSCALGHGHNPTSHNRALGSPSSHVLDTFNWLLQGREGEPALCCQAITHGGTAGSAPGLAVAQISQAAGGMEPNNSCAAGTEGQVFGRGWEKKSFSDFPPTLHTLFSPLSFSFQPVSLPFPASPVSFTVSTEPATSTVRIEGETSQAFGVGRKGLALL